LSRIRLRRIAARSAVTAAAPPCPPPPCSMLVKALWYRTLNWARVIVAEPTCAITCEVVTGAGWLELHAARPTAHIATIATPPLRWNILRPVYRGLPPVRLAPPPARRTP